MNHIQTWEWLSLLVLGAWHGANPGMGWLLAAAQGLQMRSGRAVWGSLIPIATGHFLAMGMVVTLGILAGATVPFQTAKVGIAALMFGFGVYRLIAQHHPSWKEKRVSFPGLALWSFLMASAHGAGIMLLPILLGMSAAGMSEGSHHHHQAAFTSLQAGLLAMTIHTLAYLLVTGVVAWIAYRQLGATLPKIGRINLDLIWAIALIATAVLTLFIS